MDDMVIVGEYTEAFNNYTGQTLPLGHIYKSPGLLAHIRRHHPGTESNLDLIPIVITEPDYIGKNPKEPDSVELVKTISDNVMVCIKLDKANNYLYVASVFCINKSKLNNRIDSGRLIKT